MQIVDYVNEPCLNICLYINLHKPDADGMKLQAYVNKIVNPFALS